MSIQFSYIGDSFWNKCLYTPNYPEKLSGIVSMFFRWTEPHVLVEICLVILILLPLIFMARSDESLIKISRLYNISRLSILTLFHKILYIYLIFIPLAYFIGQPPPCVDATRSVSVSFQRLYSFPSPKLGSLCIALFYVNSLLTISRKKIFIVTFIIAILFGLHFMFNGNLSVSQTFFSISLAYILHFYSQRVPFFVLHIENLIFTILIFLIMFGAGPNFMPGHASYPNYDFLGRMISAITLLVIDWYMIARYHYTRFDYAKIGRPIDIQVEAGEGQYFSILSSEEEQRFVKNLKNDVIDSLIACILFLIGVDIRHYFTGIIKPSIIGLI